MMDFDTYQPSAGARIFRSDCRRRRETNPLFRAVLANDLVELKRLVKEGNSVNVQNAKGSSLINFAMRRKRVEIFDYLIDLQEVDVNYLDRLGQSPLIYLAGFCFDEYFALKLIEKQCDIHATDDCGFSFLHLAAKSDYDDSLQTGKILIEMGADIDQRGHFGMTPLYIACESGNFDWVCMLLFYGADVTIPSDRGLLPISVICQDLYQLEDLQELLYNYTFSETEKVPVSLATIVAAMTQPSDTFRKMVNACDIEFDDLDLQYFASSLIQVQIEHLKLFVENFGYIVKEMFNSFPTLDILLKVTLAHEFSGLKNIINVFLESGYCSDFVQNCDSTKPIVALLLEAFNNEEKVDEDEFSAMVTVMLTYGLNVHSTDLDAVFNYFGYCDLFKLMLNMDVSTGNPSDSLAVLFYNPEYTLDQYIQCGFHSIDLLSYFRPRRIPLDFSRQFLHILDYYNHGRFKDFVLAGLGQNKDLLAKIQSLPKVPLLVELSRNAARSYIVNRFQTKSSVQFYTVLQQLPIGNMNKKIIALEKPLYSF